MKTPLRYIFLPIISFLLFIFILLVDISFYKVPNFIKAFRHERELVVVIASLCLFFTIRYFYKKHFQSIQKQLLLIPIVLVFYFPAVPLLHHIFSEDLILWGNNPMLAARPFYWNLFSTFASLVTVSMILILLLIVHDLILYRRKSYTPFIFNATIILFLIFTFYLNTVDSRYSYSPLLPPLVRQTLLASFILALIVVFSILNSFRTQWARYLTRKEKVLSFISGLLILPLIVYIYLSPEKITYYSYSISIKAFVTVSLFFIAVYFLFSLLTIFFHLPTAGVYDRFRNEMISINELSGMIIGSENLQNVLQNITKFSCELLSGTTAWLELFSSDGETLEIYASENLPESVRKSMNLNPHLGLSNYIITSSKTQLFHDIQRSRYCESLVRTGIPVRSLLVAPLIIKDRVRGLLLVGKNQTYAFDQEDQNLFEVFVSQASVALETSRLYQESLEKERIARELKIATEAQMRLLPEELPFIPGYDISAFCQPAREVGGDFYDYHYLEDQNRLVLIIADVSDKGAAAAFYMSLAKGVLNSLADQGMHPADVLKKANRILLSLFDSKSFITLIYFDMDLANHKCRFCRAGHTPLLFYNSINNSVEKMTPAGLALSLIDEPDFSSILEEISIDINPGDIFLFYTDGISETRNSQGIEFGEEKLISLMHRNKQKSPEELRLTILNELQEFKDDLPQMDDHTMLIIKRQELSDV